MDTSIILEDIFEVKNMNPDGKKFDKVSRLICESENYEMDLVLDVNTDIYPIELGERLTLALATSLDLKGRGDQGYWDYGESERATLADRYEYVMYGRVFKYSPDSRQEKVAIYVSFGGLLMRLTGDPRNMTQIKPDINLYLLMRKNA
jgi:DNA-directed RNA polymerase I, II, and III subunit RPABC3